MNDVLILGDSTSMTIGLENESYPYKLAQKSTWKPFTRFINCSQPGFTSADACAFFFNHYNKYSNIVAVIINLGTCDSFSSEIKKGKYTLRKHLYFKIKQTFFYSNL